MGNAFLHKDEHRPKVNVHHPVPIVDGRVLDGAVADNTGRVDQDVDLSKGIDGIANYSVDLRQFKDIAEVHLDRTFVLLNALREGSQFLLIAADSDNTGPVLRKQSCCRPSDTAARTCNDSDFSLHIWTA